MVVEYIDDIKTRIETVKNKTDNSIFDETKINKFLDDILYVKKMVDEITSDIDILVDDLYRFLSNASRVECLEVKPKLDSLFATVVKIYTRIRRSDLYSGVKSSVEEYYSSMQYLKEFICDMDTSIKLSNDEEFIKLMNTVNEILS